MKPHSNKIFKPFVNLNKSTTLAELPLLFSKEVDRLHTEEFYYEGDFQVPTR